MANAANFRSDFSSASRESASEAEVAKRGVAHVDRLARGARSAPSPAAAPRSPHHLRSAASSDRPSAIVSPDPRFRKRTKIATCGSRREPLGRRSAPAAGAGRSAHADARRAPRARVRAASMVNAANFRSDFSSASRESASEAEVAKRGVAHVDRLARGARSAPSPAAAPRSPHPHPLGRVERSPERHRQPRSEIRTKEQKSATCGSRREPLGRRSAPAAGAGRSAHADARRAPRARVGAASMANAANFRSDFSSASRESASEAEVAKRGVAHVDRLARGARSAPSPAAAPRSPHPHPPAASSDRPSAIVSPDPRLYKEKSATWRQPARAARSPQRPAAGAVSV